VAEPRAKGCSAKALGKLLSSWFVHQSVFEIIFGKKGSMRAGDLAMKALKASPTMLKRNERKRKKMETPRKEPNCRCSCGLWRTSRCQK
jgi:hypothetical protein